MISTQAFENLKPGKYVRLDNHKYVPCLSTDKQKIGRCISIVDGVANIELKVKAPLEDDLIAKFERHFQSPTSNFYHLQTGINGSEKVGIGQPGRPDYLYSTTKYPLIQWSIEFKRDKTINAAIKALRSTQESMIGAMNTAGIPVYLIFDGGCVEFYNHERTELLDGTTPFSAFSSLIEERYNKK